MRSAAVIDVDLVRSLLEQRRPMDEIERMTGASIEAIERIRRAFPTRVERNAAGNAIWAPHHEDLKRLHAMGKTSSEAAAFYGVSRNSIISIWSRLGLSSEQISDEARRLHLARVKERRAAYARARAANRKRVAAEAAASSSRPPPPKPRLTQHAALSSFLGKPEASTDIDDSTDVARTDLVPIHITNAQGRIEANSKLTESCCRWPVGEVGTLEFGFCGRTKVPGLPYCEAHARRAFALPKPRAPRAAPAPAPARVPTFADSEVE